MLLISFYFYESLLISYCYWPFCVFLNYFILVHYFLIYFKAYIILFLFLNPFCHCSFLFYLLLNCITPSLPCLTPYSLFMLPLIIIFISFSYFRLFFLFYNVLNFFTSLLIFAIFCWYCWCSKETFLLVWTWFSE